MLSYTLIGLAAGFVSRAAAATCTGPLKIDDFSKWSSNTNSLNQWTSDDGTMSSISAANGVLSFKPKANSYFYESFTCQAASSNGYNAVTFSYKGPAGGSSTLEIQTQTSCSVTKYTSQYVSLSGLTGNTQTITVPLSQFTGANANAVTAFVWSGFSSTTTTWQLSNIQFACGAAGASSTLPSSKPASSNPVASSKPVSSAIVASSKPASSSVIVSSSKPSSSSVAAAPSSKLASSSVVVSSSKPASSAVPSSIKSTSSSQPTSSTLTKVSTSASAVSSTAATGACSPALIDDWTSQSRLTFLFYNAMLQPSSDDGTMTSVVVGTPSANRVTLNPKDGSSYFYSQFNCFNAGTAYGGISLKIKAASGTTLSIELDSSATCDPTKAVTQTLTSKDLGWTFDGTEKLYTIPFSKYTQIDKTKLTTVLFGSLSKSVSFGPMSFYCGSTAYDYPITSTPVPQGPSSTVATPAGTAAALVVDKFASADSNALGFWHGADDGLTVTYSGGKVTLKSTDPDLAYYSQLSSGCTDYSKYEGSYLHIAYSGTVAFTISLQQHNKQCSDKVSPFPETWDSVEASRYAKNGNIYIPMNHFNIDFSRTVGFAIKGFYKSDPVTLSLIEIIPSVPSGTAVPNDLESGDLVFSCKRPNSFAFAIDDGSPEYAQQVLQVIREEGIKVTFFTVGAPLLDASTNLTNVYREMQAQGHQIALHSFTHPKMEGLPDYGAIDWEYNQDIAAVNSQLNGLHTPYFRPPFGTEGARMRQRLAITLGQKPTVTMWSVDVEDWLWAQTDTPEQQLTSFQRDVDAGGNLVVLHYLYPTTVSYLRQFIQKAKATGKQLMRVDQCMMDPNAPPL